MSLAECASVSCSPKSAHTSKILIVGSGATFRRGPSDDFVRVLDVTSFAVHAIGRIDLQSPRAIVVLHHLVNAGRAEVLAGIAVLTSATRDANGGICDFKM